MVMNSGDNNIVAKRDFNETETSKTLIWSDCRSIKGGTNLYRRESPYDLSIAQLEDHEPLFSERSSGFTRLNVRTRRFGIECTLERIELGIVGGGGIGNWSSGLNERD